MSAYGILWRSCFGIQTANSNPQFFKQVITEDELGLIAMIFTKSHLMFYIQGATKSDQHKTLITMFYYCEGVTTISMLPLSQSVMKNTLMCFAEWKCCKKNYCGCGKWWLAALLCQITFLVIIYCLDFW